MISIDRELARSSQRRVCGNSKPIPMRPGCFSTRDDVKRNIRKQFSGEVFSNAYDFGTIEKTSIVPTKHVFADMLVRVSMYVLNFLPHHFSTTPMNQM